MAAERSCSGLLEFPPHTGRRKIPPGTKSRSNHQGTRSGRMSFGRKRLVSAKISSQKKLSQPLFPDSAVKRSAGGSTNRDSNGKSVRTLTLENKNYSAAVSPESTDNRRSTRFSHCSDRRGSGRFPKKTEPVRLTGPGLKLIEFRPVGMRPADKNCCSLSDNSP